MYDNIIYRHMSHRVEWQQEAKWQNGTLWRKADMSHFVSPTCDCRDIENYESRSGLSADHNLLKQKG
jgi:hypothetical protein